MKYEKDMTTTSCGEYNRVEILTVITIIFMGVNVIIVFIINVINDKGNYWLVFDNENPAAIILTPSDTVTKINVTIFIIFLLFLLIFDSQVYFHFAHQ